MTGPTDKSIEKFISTLPEPIPDFYISGSKHINYRGLVVDINGNHIAWIISNQDINNLRNKFWDKYSGIEGRAMYVYKYRKKVNHYEHVRTYFIGPNGGLNRISPVSGRIYSGWIK